MSFTCALVMVLLGSSVVIAFVLQPSREESDGSVTTAGLHQRFCSCHDVSLQSIKNDLLRSLNLQAEPQVPVGLVDSVREQWKQTFSAVSNQAPGPEEVQSASSDDGNSSSLKCCYMTSEVFIKDLGWSNWVIYPLSLTFTHCRVCSDAGNTVRCPCALNDQVSCCYLTFQKAVPIAYIDEFGNVMISSVQPTTECGCVFVADTNPQPINK